MVGVCRFNVQNGVSSSPIFKADISEIDLLTSWPSGEFLAMFAVVEPCLRTDDGLGIGRLKEHHSGFSKR